jgi:hypothetical protein
MGAEAPPIVGLYAALKRRSSTGVRAFKIKGKVKGSGQECPLHTGKVKDSGRGARFHTGLVWAFHFVFHAVG